MQRNILEYLEQTEIRYPHKTAFSNGKESMSFCEVGSAARAIGSRLLEDGFYEFTSVCIAVISPEEREAFVAGLTPEANWLSDLPEEVKAVLPFEGGYDHILLYDHYTGEYNCLPTEEGRYYFTCLLYDEETGTVTLWEFPWEIVATS